MFTILLQKLLAIPTVFALETELPGDIPETGAALSVYINRLYDPYLLVLGYTMAVGMFVYSGIIYTTSSGNPEKIAHAKDMFVNTLIGLAVLLLGGLILSLINPN